MTDQSELATNIQKSFDSTLTDSNLQSLTIDISELAIDSVLKDGLLRELPIVGTMSSLSKLGANIHDRLFLKKILAFMNQLKEVPQEKRKQMVEEIDRSQKHRIKVGEKLLYIIDSCEDYEISELVSRVFRAYIEEKISYNEFLKTASVLRKINIGDFKWFIKERKSYYFDMSDAGDLIGTGLFEIYYDDINVSVEEITNTKSKTDLVEDDYQNDKREYDTNVDGGVSVNLSRAGEIILELFCPSYKKPKSMNFNQI